MKTNWRVVLVSLLIFSLVSVVAIQAIREGLGHSDARNHFSRARQGFDTGDYGHSLKSSLVGVWVTIDSGTRWMIGEPHLVKAQTMLYERKDLYGALDECELAQAIIGSTYDNEDMVSILCWRIKAEINPDIWQNPLLPVPTKTLEP